MKQLAVGTIAVTPFQQNCTLLFDEQSRRAVVVDPGGEPEKILAGIARQGLSVEAIWLTHGHLDHAGGAAALKAALGEAVPVMGPMVADTFLLEGLAAQATAFGIQGVQAVTPDRWLGEGDMLEFDGHRFEVLHCPGHTPGHVVFFCKASRFAQVGDVLFAGSVGRTDFAYSDPAALIASIKTKLLPLGDEIDFICGHGPGSTFGRERRSNPFL